jgi:hypothetical protein
MHIKTLLTWFEDSRPQDVSRKRRRVHTICLTDDLGDTPLETVLWDFNLYHPSPLNNVQITNTNHTADRWT